MEKKVETWVNERKASEILGLSVFTLRAYRFRRCGPAYSKVGRAVRYAIEDLHEFMDERRVMPTRVYVGEIR